MPKANTQYAARWDFLGSSRIGQLHASLGAANTDADYWRRLRSVGRIAIVAFENDEFRDLNAAERDAEKRPRGSAAANG